MYEEQRQAAKGLMNEWLAGAREMEKPPVKLESAGTFELQHLRYYIFRFKKSMLGRWMLAVCGGFEGEALVHNGQCCTDMAEYDAATAEQNAIRMVEQVREYYIARAREELEKRDPAPTGGVRLEYRLEDRVGSFVGYVLLQYPIWELRALRGALAEWGIETPEINRGQSLIFGVGELLVALNMITGQVPDGAAEYYAASNQDWPQAVNVAHAHTAHIMVTVMGRGQSPVEVGKCFVRVCDACMLQSYATGIYTTGTVLSPSFYHRAAAVMHEGDLPVFNWVYFGHYPTPEGTNAFTYGLSAFGREELEVVGSELTPVELKGLLFNVAHYVLSQDVLLHDGDETVYSETERLLFHLTKGVSLESYTIKIQRKER